MSNLFVQIAAMIIGTVILSFFGIGGGNHKVTIRNGKSSTKKWKVVIILGIVTLLGGLSMFSQNFSNGGFQNPYTGTGLLLVFIGVIVFFIGRFGRWWSRD